MDTEIPTESDIPGEDIIMLEKLPADDVALLIIKNLNALAILLLCPIEKGQELSTDDRIRIQRTLDWQYACLSQIKKPKGTRPFAVIRKLKVGDKKYLALDVGKVTPEGEHYSRVFFGSTLAPIMLRIDPETGNILTTADGKSVVGEFEQNTREPILHRIGY